MQDIVRLSQFKAIDAISESDWHALASAVSVRAERRFCLQHVLLLNRRNALARRALEELGPGPVRCPLLPYALAALEDDREREARRILETIVQVDPGSEMGWLALAATVENRSERRYCLKRALLLNHRNALARRALSKQGDGPTSSPLLSSARVALAAGRQSEARAMLESVLELTPDAEGTWLLLADAVDTIPERRFCFQQVMMLEPENGTAKRELEVLGFGLAWSPLVDYVTLPQRETGTQLPRWLKSLRSFVSSKIALLAVVYLVALVTA